jgi:hypothetical protein
VLDAILADVVTEADRWRDGIEGDTDEAAPLPGAGEAQDGLGPDDIRSNEARPAPASRPVEIPHVLDGFLGRRLRLVPVSDALLDELAAAVGSPGRLAVPADPIARPETPQEPGKGLAKLAATLIVTGSWSHRARFRGVTSQKAGRPCERKESE